MPPADHLPRHYGLDWLRIGAFALLILYHVAMVFAPWHWVVKWPHTVDALVVPMALLTPWRLPLLFAVSGFATRRMMVRAPDTGTFVTERAARLLLPLAFGILVLLPPELWVRARLAGDPLSLGDYWAREYWLPHPAFGVGFPAWEHLWFVVYLGCYTLLVAILAAAGGLARLDRAGAWLEKGARLLWAPTLLLVVTKLALLFVVPERHGLTSDWSGHATYLAFFALGLVLGGRAAPWAALHRVAFPALAVAVASGAVVAAVERAFPGDLLPGHALMALDRAAQVTMAWAAVIALIALADRALNRDHRWRAPLAEAVFPAYLVHHPVIVVTAWALAPLGLSAPLGFALIAAVTAAACVGFYLAARRVGWLRPLAGLTPRKRRERQATMALRAG